MLHWDEEVTPTASLSPSSRRSDPLIASRFSGPAATFSEAAPKPTASPLVANSIVLGTYCHIPTSECRQLLLGSETQVIDYQSSRALSWK